MLQKSSFEWRPFLPEEPAGQPVANTRSRWETIPCACKNLRRKTAFDPGADAAALEATLAAALRPHLPPEALAGAPLSLLLRPGARGEHAVSAESERLLLVLAGVAGVVLLIACVNLAGLMLARAARRERDLAVRRALGAPGKRLARVVLTESLVLACAGALGGLVLTLAAKPLVNLLASAGAAAALLALVAAGGAWLWWRIVSSTPFAAPVEISR